MAAASQKSQRVAAVTVQAVIRKGRFGFGRKPLAKMDSGTADLDAISVSACSASIRFLELARKNTVLAKYLSVSIRTGFLASTTSQPRVL